MTKAAADGRGGADRARRPGDDRHGLEPWCFFAFGLAGLTAAGLVYLGSRPGGAGPVWVYSTGLLGLGLLSAASLALALVWCALRRPALQRGRLWGLVSLAAVLWATSFPLAYPSSYEGHPSRVSFRLPFDGEWTVRQGGGDRTTNTLVLHPARRYGWHFEPPSVGAPVVSPADGEVVSAGPIGWVLRVEEGEYLVLEGVERFPSSPGSSTGELVRAGDPVGRAGEHGVLMFLQDGPVPAAAEGIPLRFSAVLADGREIRPSIPVRGQRVRPLPAASREKPSR